MNKEDEFHLALGRFVEKFADTETAMKIAYWKFTGMDLATARAVAGSLRASAMSVAFRRIYDARSIQMPTPIDQALQHFATINAARDLLVHHGSEINGDEVRVITNRLMSHTAVKTKTFPISADLLANMSADLGTIIHRMLAHFVGKPRPMPDLEWSAFELRGQTPWLYKPPQPVKENPEHALARKDRPKKK